MVMYPLQIHLPFEDPILIFALIVIVILLTPIVFRKIKVPGIVGLIAAGVILGPHGFNILMRDASIVLFGTVGLLYIMFLSGLEMDLEEFRKKIHKSATFGILTFIIPMGLGTLVAFYILDFSMAASVLLASMFASHTLLAYPIISKLGLTKTEAATVTFGGTLITNILALLVLSVIVAMVSGDLNRQFWVLLSVYSLMFGIIVFAGIPRIGSWFFKNFEGEGVSHYLFVLAVVFGSSFLAGVFRLEPIIGAFVAGLALNRLIPPASPLMNRIEFVGNTLFIPFFLIGTGMLVDLSILFNGAEAIGVAITMIIVATSAKWIAAYLTQKSFGYTSDERNMIFGLSNAQAASTLAAVVIGYNIGLFNESILNGTILMILVTCLISSFVTDRAGRNMAVTQKFREPELSDSHERILVPIANPSTIDKLMDLAFFIRNPKSVEPVYPLTVVIEKGDQDVITGKLLEGNKMLESALVHGSSTDKPVQLISKVDLNVSSGIIRACKELLITDMVIGWNGRLGAREKIFGSILDIIVKKIPVNIMVYKPLAPLNTVSRVYLVAPENAEYEKGFEKWLIKVIRISKQTKASIRFYGVRATMNVIENKLAKIQEKSIIKFNEFEKWTQFYDLASAITPSDLLIVVSGRQGSISYTKHHDIIPKLLSKYFYAHNFIILYPEVSASGHEVDSNLQLEVQTYSPFTSRKTQYTKPGEAHISSVRMKKFTKE
jgi:Kef-type K+ transport system membrane component KefB